MTTEGMINRIAQTDVQIPTQQSESILALSAQLGVPPEHRPGYIRGLYIALGMENQPARAINYLRFKIASSRGTSGVNGE